uniref:Uncharacterized protein n=1 Tax=Eutreptiella gymnastica TaxID=73025 RepID=A0A7S1NN91_9EUGL
MGTEQPTTLRWDGLAFIWFISVVPGARWLHKVLGVSPPLRGAGGLGRNTTLLRLHPHLPLSPVWVTRHSTSKVGGASLDPMYNSSGGACYVCHMHCWFAVQLLSSTAHLGSQVGEWVG